MIDQVLAHGVGGRQDLPIPFGYAVTAAAVALVISFVTLGVAWRQPRLASDGTAGRPVPGWLTRTVDSAAWRYGWRAAGLLAAGYFCLGLVVGPDVPANPTPGVVYVLFWVGLVPASLLFGPVWRGLNPLRTLTGLLLAALRRDPATGLRALPAGVGYWPAAAGLFAFVWLELVAPDRATTPVIGAWLAGYAIAALGAGVVFGTRFFDRGDAFEVYSDLVGRLAPLGRRRDGVLVWRNPLDGISSLVPAPGLVVFVTVLLGSTLYDSVSNAPFWVAFAQEQTVALPVTNTIGLLAVIGLVLAAYLAATVAAGRAAGPDRVLPARAVPGELAHSIVPIAVGYLLAHYYSLFVLEGQRTLALLSDPLVTGRHDWLGTAGWQLDASLITPSSVATFQVTVIVLGHLIGTVLAHDRSLALLPGRAVVRGQLPLLGLMVAYTVAGLFLLFAG